MPSATSPAQLASIAKRAFPTGGLAIRTLQHYRPYICPFEALLPHVPLNASILDVGCGGGLFLALVNATREPARVVGFDASTHAISMALANLTTFPPPAPDIRQLDVGAPWPQGPFDVVSLIDVLHHIPPPHQQSVLLQCVEHLAPGGTLLFKDMTPRGLIRPTMNRLHDLLLARQWIHYAHPDTVLRWMQDAGLTCTHRSFHTRLWYGHELLVFVKPK
jgi:2-polyprenyl-3-methyl-5-hydroxy-6-metoxy-1,4-benzoquinol methylase